MTPAHLRVGDDALHAAIDHGFYARPATFYRVYEDMFAAARGPYSDQGHAYFPLDYENLVRAYRLDAVNDAHVRMLKRHPTPTYRYRRVNVVKAAAFLVYPTSVYNRDTDKLIRNIERHLRANLTIDNGIYTNKNRGNRVFSSEKFHLVHALAKGARFADFAAPTVGVLLGNRPAPKTCPRPTPHAATATYGGMPSPTPPRPSERTREAADAIPDAEYAARISGGKMSACGRRRTTRCWTRGGTRWPEGRRRLQESPRKDDGPARPGDDAPAVRSRDLGG